MSLSKELFGIKRKQPYTPAISGPGIDNSQFNDCLDLIDQFEISEEELMNIIDELFLEVHPMEQLNIVQAIIKNKSKIFKRKI